MKRALAVFVALVWIVAGAPPPAFAATTVQLTVSLYRVVELHCDEGAGESCGNDYYPKFELDHQGLYDGSDDLCCAHGADFRTNWVRQATVDVSHNPVAIHMELWDQDDLSADDVIHWVKTGDYLDLQFDLNTCVFTGGGLSVEQGANLPTLAGQSETSGADSARGYFTITTPDCIERTKTIDSDGDGIMNAWESPTQGFDVNNDGVVDLPLGLDPYNAVPYRKDLFVEADYMTGDQPQNGALQQVVQAFANAPVDPYPDPADPAKTKYLGVALHTFADDQVPNVPALLFQTSGPGAQDDFNDLKNGAPGGCDGFFGTATERASANCVQILDAKRQVYRYMIFGNTFSENTKSSGISEYSSTAPRGGNDFMVTLESWGAKSIANAGGRQNAEAATFMHELGHTLGLGHGGGDDTLCKPNYPSIMNYTQQFADFDPNRPLDYTSALRGTALGLTPQTVLDEAHLNENVGVHGTPNPNRVLVYGVNGKSRTAPASAGPTDWNGVNGSLEPDVAADLDYIEAITSCKKVKSPGETLGGFDDWANLQYNPRLNAGFFADGARPNLPVELTEDDVLAMSQKADLSVTKTADQTTAAGGDTLTYSVAVSDLGPGTATGVTLTDTMPDGSTQQRALPDLPAGAVNQVTPKFSYLVPCSTADGTVFTNRVSVDGADTDHVPDPNRSDNTASASTVVHAPALGLRTSATSTVDAGAAITYNVTYTNTGGGAASNVVVTDTLPAGVYYSTALDLGAGPRPTTVTLNADGSRTLTWNVGAVPAASGDRTITFTARPGLLVANGSLFTSTATARYANVTSACTFAPLTAAATTGVTVAPPTRNPLGIAYWSLHPNAWTAELLARIQATDQRYDTNHDGALTQAEVTAAYRDLTQALRGVLSQQLLTTYFNLASKRVNASTGIRSIMASLLGLSTVGGAVGYATATLALPLNISTTVRYSSTITVLDSLNNNIIEVY